MVQKLAGALLVLFFFCGIASGMSAQGVGKIATPGGYPALAARIGQKGSVRLIVKVDSAFQPPASSSSHDSQLQMNLIEAEEDAVIADIAPFNPKSIHKFRYVPYLFMDVDEKALNALLASPSVVDVHEDIPELPTLDGVTKIGAPSLWNYYVSSGFDGTGVVVAVLDTGVEKNHPFLSSAVVSEACYSTNSTNVQSLCPGGVTDSTVADSALPYASGVCSPAPTALPGTGKCDHGTHVAGIIAGRQNVSGAPVGGVAPGAKLIAIQVFSRFNSTADCGTGAAPCIMAYTSDIMKGLERVYALRSTYNISSVNLSLGGGLYSTNCDTDPRKPLIDSLKAAGIATVISSGNNSSCGSLSAPACISSAVSVGATDDSDAVVYFSNSSSFLSLLAPGSLITSSVPPTVPAGSPVYPYVSMSGTSMAAPHVAGSWALMKQAKPGDTVDQILAAFSATGPSVTDLYCASVTKKRIKLDGADGALSYLGSGPSAQTDAATNITQTTATLNGTVNANNTTTVVTFEYGTDTSYGSSGTALQSPVSGSTLTPVSLGITGLSPDTLYHYMVKAGTSSGNDMTFTTPGNCVSVADGSFEGGTPNASWVETSVNFGTPLCTFVSCPGGEARTGTWFAWFGGILAPETSSLTQSVNIPAASSPRLEFSLMQLGQSSGNHTDNFRVLVDGTEIFGVTEGSSLSGLYGGAYLLTGLDLSAYADGAFHSIRFQGAFSGTGTTPTNFLLDDVSITCGPATTLPTVTTGAASAITATGATLNGTVNANNASTVVSFDYGTSTSYGSSATAAGSPVTGIVDTAVSAALAGLTPGATYHYRTVGSSSTGRAYGTDMTFITSCSPGSIVIGVTPYELIQSAIDSAADGDVIKVKTANFVEVLSFTGTGTVTLKGGYDCAFVSNTGFTTVTGEITFSGTRTVILENVVVQ